jgi:hypothetical protein
MAWSWKRRRACATIEASFAWWTLERCGPRGIALHVFRSISAAPKAPRTDTTKYMQTDEVWGRIESGGRPPAPTWRSGLSCLASDVPQIGQGISTAAASSSDNFPASSRALLEFLTFLSGWAASGEGGSAAGAKSSGSSSSASRLPRFCARLGMTLRPKSILSVPWPFSMAHRCDHTRMMEAAVP